MCSSESYALNDMFIMAIEAIEDQWGFRTERGSSIFHIVGLLRVNLGWFESCTAGEKSRFLIDFTPFLSPQGPSENGTWGKIV